METAKMNRIEYTNKLLLISMIFLVLPLISGSLGTYKQGSCIEIKTILNSSWVNISTISYPNSSLLILNTNMTKAGQTFLYPFCDTSILGVYLYDYYDDVGNVYVNDFEVNYLGIEITTEQVNIYIIGLLFLVLLILGITVIMAKLPSKDSINDEGEVIQISYLKHLRHVLWVVNWAIALGIIFIISNLSLTYLPNEMLGNFFFMLYQIMFWITIIGAPIYFLWIFYRFFKDREFQRMIERGIDSDRGGLI